MRILIAGAGGMLGRELQEAAKLMTGGVDWRVAAFSHDDLDIADSKKVSAAFAIAVPAAVVNCAAYTNVDGCETEQEAAYRLNGEAPGVLAEVCRAEGALLVHFSTDYVFDGSETRPYSEDDPVAPLSVYGRSKLAGERAIRAQGEDHLIIRSQWLYGRYGKNFVDTVLERATAGEKLKVVNDQHGAPTYARDLAVATLEALAKKLRGTFHAVNSGQCTWYDVARNTLTLAGLDPALVTPVRTEELPRPAQRPAWGVLDTAKLAGEGIKMCPWEEALEIYVKRERPGAKGEGGGVAVPKEQKH